MNELDTQFKKYCSLITTFTIKSKDCHVKTFFDKNKTDLLDLRQRIKKLIKTTPTKRSQPKMQNINKKLTRNNYAFPTEFNIIFNTIAEKMIQN